MIDFAKITVIAGSGGDGSGSFTHIKGKRRGKADGGDGGRGGNVFLEATLNLNTLEPFRYIKEYRASNGGNGASRKRKGVSGEELVVKVPTGTLVKEVKMGPALLYPHPTSSLDSNFINDSKDFSDAAGARWGSPKQITHFDKIFDLMKAEQRILVAAGGAGGKGNIHLRDEYGRRPFRGEKGKEGEKVELELELKLIADVGLIGLPNAGKSTLISAITSATPKVADYPFTTLEPNLGVMTTDYSSSSLSLKTHQSLNDLSLRAEGQLPTTDKPASLVIADIPGLIEGASLGKGLGHLFLRHIERTKLLVHLIDVSLNQDLWKVYQTIRSELRSYSKELSKKKEIIVLNKIDLMKKEELDEVINQFKSHRKKVIPISAKLGMNLEELIKEILRRLK